MNIMTLVMIVHEHYDTGNDSTWTLWHW